MRSIKNHEETWSTGHLTCAVDRVKISLPTVFPTSAKKCEILSSIFAQIFHKCKTGFNSGVFHFEKPETTFNLWRRYVWCGAQ